MECPICLEPMGPGSILGRIHGCLHTYHRHCVEQWSANSNSCPTCRKTFHGIDFVAFETPRHVLNTVSIKDRLLGTDAINQIPSEYVISPQMYASQQRRQNALLEDAENTQPGVCLICSSAQVSRRRNNMVACISCGGKFHMTCLGHSGEPSWFCPVCDCHQEIPVAVAPSRPVMASVIVRTSTSPRRTVPAARSVAVSGQRGRLLLSDSSDTPFSEDFPDFHDFEEPHSTRNPRSRTAVWNGGALLRRQARELQNLTPEERSAWSMLESARSGLVDEIEGHNSTESSVPRRKRRPRTVPSNTSVGTSADTNTNKNNLEVPSANEGSANSPINVSEQGPVRGPSRIASLMNQIKGRPTTHKKTESQFSGGFSGIPKDSIFRANSSASSSVGLGSPSLSPVESQNSTPRSTSPRPLSLEEKSKVQTHVRNNLRPLYHNTQPGTRSIGTEDEYIRINKGISRKVYSHISSLCASKGPGVYGDLFEGDSEELKLLVDSCVEGWPFDKS